MRSFRRSLTVLLATLAMSQQASATLYFYCTQSDYYGQVLQYYSDILQTDAETIDPIATGARFFEENRPQDVLDHPGVAGSKTSCPSSSKLSYLQSQYAIMLKSAAGARKMPFTRPPVVSKPLAAETHASPAVAQAGQTKVATKEVPRAVVATPGGSIATDKAGALPTATATTTLLQARKAEAAVALRTNVTHPVLVAEGKSVQERRSKQRRAELAKARPPRETASTRSEPSGCVSQPVIGPNPACQNKGITGTVSNHCPQPVDVRMCFYTSLDRWDCRVSWGVPPGADWSQSACLGTGQVFTSVRNTGTDRPLTTPP